MSNVHPVYKEYLQYDKWAEVSREQMLVLLATVHIQFSRLTRLEDKRVWEAFYDLDQLGFQFDTADEIISAFNLNRHDTLMIVRAGGKLDNCLGNEVQIGLLVIDTSRSPS